MQRRHRTAFTLVELVVVVLILGILAAVAAPHVLTEVEESQDSALARSREIVQSVIDHQFAITGSYPSTIESQWFVGNKLPTHVFLPDGVPLFEIVSEPGTMDPTEVVLDATSPGGFWYNTANGALRARVHFDDSEEDTLELYDEVNLSGLAEEED